MIVAAFCQKFAIWIMELDSIILVGSFQLRLFCGSLTTEQGGQDIKKAPSFLNLPLTGERWNRQEEYTAHRDCDIVRD